MPRKGFGSAEVTQLHYLYIPQSHPADPNPFRGTYCISSPNTGFCLKTGLFTNVRAGRSRASINQHLRMLEVNTYSSIPVLLL